MSSGVQVVATDLDGTLVDKWTRVNRQDRLAVRFLRQQRVPLVFASGRTLDSILHLLHRRRLLLTPRDFLVANNGSLTYSCRQQQVVSEYSFPSSLVARVMAAAEQHQLLLLGFPRHGANVVVRNHRRFTLPLLFWKLVRGRHKRLSRYDASHAVPLTKLIIVGKRSLLQKFRTEVLDQERVVAYNGSQFFYSIISVAPFATSKQAAINQICQTNNITAPQVMFIGDGNNDVSALAWAGVSVAVANATGQAKCAAKEVTAAVHEAGFARAIARHFKAFAPQLAPN